MRHLIINKAPWLIICFVFFLACGSPNPEIQNIESHTQNQFILERGVSNDQTPIKVQEFDNGQVKKTITIKPFIKKENPVAKRPSYQEIERRYLANLETLKPKIPKELHKELENNYSETLNKSLSLDCNCQKTPDFDDSGFVNTQDLLYFLGLFGVYGDNLPGDFNCDGVVNTFDLMDFLPYFGNPYTDTNLGTGSMELVYHIDQPGEYVTLNIKPGDYIHTFSVDWGDGSAPSEVLSYSDSNKQHSYTEVGDYSVKLCGTSQGWGKSTTLNPDALIGVPNLGNMGWLDLNLAFYQHQHLISVSGGDTSNVTNMSGMFRFAIAANPETSNWDVSNVTNMSRMFENATSANPNTLYWDVSNVTNMSGMFINAIIANPETSDWDVSNVTNMSEMFRFAIAANPETSNWDVSNVTNMSEMFTITHNANPYTSSWNVANVTDMSRMFDRAMAANPDVSNWDVSSVVNMKSMFQFTDIANPDVSNWDVSSVVNMKSMFASTLAANPDVSNWDVSNVVNMSAFFATPDQLMDATLDFDPSNWNLQSVQDMSDFCISNHCGISVESYSALLEQIQTTATQSNVGLKVTTYYLPTSQAARDYITGTLNWTVNDYGPQ